MRNLTVKIKGVSPLLMHNGDGANPLNPKVKVQKQLTGKKQKTDADHIAIARGEWEISLYYNEAVGPYLPAVNIEGSIKAAAKLQKMGTKFGQAVLVVESEVPLQYKGPRDLDGLFDAGFSDVRGVKNPGSQARVMRCRPKFNEWAAEFTVAFDEDVVNLNSVKLAINEAGKRAGLGDYRPEKGGRYGKFEVTEVTE